MIERLEDSLNGGYGGLYGEVVTEDIYGLRKLPFVPDIIFDLGANVGIFTRFARELFPKAKIVAVEPHPGNIEVFKQFTPMDNIILLECAIGYNGVYRVDNDLNGAHESYANIGVIEPHKHVTLTSVLSIMPNTLIDFYFDRGQGKKAILKMDIEGNERIVLYDDDSIKAILSLDYVTIELHHQPGIVARTQFLFDDLFDCSFAVKDTMFYALKKEYVTK